MDAVVQVLDNLEECDDRVHQLTFLPVVSSSLAVILCRTFFLVVPPISPISVVVFLEHAAVPVHIVLDYRVGHHQNLHHLSVATSRLDVEPPLPPQCEIAIAKQLVTKLTIHLFVDRVHFPEVVDDMCVLGVFFVDVDDVGDALADGKIVVNDQQLY